MCSTYLAGGHAELLKEVGVLDGVLHGLPQLPLDVLQSSNVVPGHVRHLNHRLAEGRGVGRSKSGSGGEG